MRLSPAATGLLKVAMPATMAILALCVQPVSKRIGTWVWASADMYAGGPASHRIDMLGIQTVRACTTGLGLSPNTTALLAWQSLPKERHLVMCRAVDYAVNVIALPSPACVL